MGHPFMEALADALARHGVASFRFQFPYMEAGHRRPDHRTLLCATVRSAVGEARRRVRGLPTVAGGKSMGGRMTSLAASEAPLPGVGGLVFVGFPLHPAGSPGEQRADHLARVERPMLFLQGGRDKLAEMPRMRRIVGRLRPRAELHEIPEADHGFHVPKRSGRTDEEVVDEIASRVARFAERRVAGPAVERAAG
jgi:predicted alpha/beta-hydrolase family hydrolase